MKSFKISAMRNGWKGVPATKELGFGKIPLITCNDLRENTKTLIGLEEIECTSMFSKLALSFAPEMITSGLRN
jgi:hypothetical protein